MMDLWGVIFSVASSITSAAVGYVAYKLKQADSARQAEAAEERRRRESERAGLIALLRERMREIYYHSFEKGEAPLYARDSFESMYHAYHDMGGNGIIDDMYERFLSLPLEK